MRYGVCNWIFGDEALSITAEHLAQAGFDGIELKGDLTLYRPSEVNLILGDYGLEVLSITPEDVDLAHPDTAVRREALDYYFRLIDFAAAIGAPLVACHGAVGRVRALTEYETEYHHLVAGVTCIAKRADKLNLRVAIEVLNRYESHLLNTAAQAIRFTVKVGADNVGVLLDAYHMNIEESDPGGAILVTGEHLFLFHAADSNREAVGRGHTDFAALLRALQQTGYTGDIVIECTAAGSDPFTPVKGQGWREEVRGFAEESLRMLKMHSSGNRH
jgi:sugar phosphate isomerase/epimerase